MTRNLVLAMALLAGCTAPSGSIGAISSAIVGGTTDTTDTSVVLVYGQIGNEASICSGEVISSHVVLTAAHCVDPATVGAGATFMIFLGSDLNDQTQQTDANFLDVASTAFDQSFNENQLQDGHDVGVVVTKNAIPRTALTVNQTPLTDAMTGTPIRLVGFGITGAEGSQTQDTSGTRRQVSTTIEGIQDNLVYYGDSQHNTCEGDSGGPAFATINGAEVIVGITSFGDQSCAQGGADTLVSAYFDSFIQPQVTAAENGTPLPTPSTTADGGTTSTSSGATDGGTIKSSSSSDGGSASTGQLGDTCEQGSECVSGICTSGAQTYCTQACNLDVANSCPANMHCEILGGSPYCALPSRKGGCSMAGVGAAPAGGAGIMGGFLLLIALALLRRRSVLVRG